MPKATTPPVMVIVNAVPKDHAAKRRTVSPSQGAPYIKVLPPCEPVVLIGQDEIDAFQHDLRSNSTKSLRLTAGQAAQVMDDLADKAAKQEIARLQKRVASLEAQLATVAEEVVAV